MRLIVDVAHRAVRLCITLAAVGCIVLCGGCPLTVQTLDGVWAITSPQQQGRACITIADGVIAGIETCRHDVETPRWLEVYDLYDSTVEVNQGSVRWSCTVERFVSDDAIATELLTLEAQAQSDGTLAGVLTLAGSGPSDGFPVTLTRWADETDPNAPELTELSYSIDDAGVTFRFREAPPRPGDHTWGVHVSRTLPYGWPLTTWTEAHATAAEGLYEASFTWDTLAQELDGPPYDAVSWRVVEVNADGVLLNRSDRSRLDLGL